LTYAYGRVTFALSPLIRGISLARKILLADDSVTAQNMGRKILADAGYEVIAVNNGSAALKKIAELKPDLVILDVYMPGYSGLEVCQRLKESQETARIPVLLSVGKLEPFKPEEAQRVRADAYIVKPFEASELLSALSKLEDKVVPRAEPSKPGRFARAMAAAEESGRGSRKEKETAGDKDGWSSRIGFPHAKTEPEEKVADESTIYNPMNRDLRTVVETAGEKAAEKAAEKKDEKNEPVAEAETNVDVAALAPDGLPKDVTPEELAAITAAAAQIHMAGASGKVEHQSGAAAASEAEIPGLQNSGDQDSRIQDFAIQASGTQVSESTSVASLDPPSDRVEESIAPPVAAEAAPEISQAHETVAPEVEPHVDSVNAEETQEPVTMAVATPESMAAANSEGPRWMAVPVALEGEESTISLEEEMQKAYAAYAAYVSAEPDSSAVAVAQEAEPVSAENSYSPEAAAPVVASPEIVAPEIVAQEVETAPAENLSSADVASFEAHAEVAPVDQVVEASAIAAPLVESVGSSEEIIVAEAGATAPEVQESQPQELQSTMEAEPVATETIVAAGEGVVPAEEPAAEYKPDSDTVKSTAAAWASWRQIRDTHKDGEGVPAQSREFEVSEVVPAEAARAVAAGAEQMMREAAAPSNGEPVDVASIVESVLANLRPKLMEEISRKMAEKK
jgi:twitching motility two-component system response regulator PilH